MDLRSAAMKTYFVLAFLATIGLLAEADPLIAKLRYDEMPVNPGLTGFELPEIVTQDTPIFEEAIGTGDGSKPQPDSAENVQDQGRDLYSANDNTAYRGQFPWQVAISIDDAHFCGGSLISNMWVLTAAHCQGRTYYARLGATRLDIKEPDTLDIVSRYFIVNTGYSSASLRNDIALVRLPYSVQFSTYISAIRLPSQFQQGNDYAGEKLLTSGWQVISHGVSTVSSNLGYLYMLGVAFNDCVRVYGSSVVSTNLCATASDDDNSCNGDSGGPLVQRENDGIYTLVGLLSFGSEAACQRGRPLVFTKVSTYLRWIQSNV